MLWFEISKGVFLEEDQSSKKCVGLRFRKIREGTGLSRSEFSAQLGFSGQYQVRDIETGRVNIPGPVVVLLSLKFGASEHWIRSGEGSPFKNKKGAAEVVSHLGETSGLEPLAKGVTVCQAACEKIRSMPLGKELLTDLNGASLWL